jgi:ribonuclease HI
VETGASNFGIGGVVSQIQDGQERVIAYYSKTLYKEERNYCVTRLELLAIVRTLEHFHKYLYGQQFHLRTDNSALTWLMSFKNLEGQTARWIQRIQEYNFTSEHR